MNLVAGFAPFILFTVLSRLSVDLALWVAFAAAFVVTIRDFVESPSLRLLDVGNLALFGVLGLVAIFLWTRVVRRRGAGSDRPLLNRRAQSYVGQEVVLDEPISDGFGRIPLGDGVWRIAGPDLPAGRKIRIVGHDGPLLRVVEA